MLIPCAILGGNVDRRSRASSDARPSTHPGAKESPECVRPSLRANWQMYTTQQPLQQGRGRNQRLGNTIRCGCLGGRWPGPGGAHLRHGMGEVVCASHVGCGWADGGGGRRGRGGGGQRAAGHGEVVHKGVGAVPGPPDVEMHPLQQTFEFAN